MNENAFYVDPYFRYGKGSFIFDLIGLQPIAIGTIEQPINQSKCGIAIGQYAGFYNQGECAIAIGEYAGHTIQGKEAIAIGVDAGKTDQGDYSIALGSEAGLNRQSSKAIAIGYLAGQNTQGFESIAIGSSAGWSNQGFQAIAIGADAGLTDQSSYAIAIGTYAGQSRQGSYAIAIGYQAGFTNQKDKSIILNASGNALNAPDSGFYVSPIRTGSSGQVLYYNSVNNEILNGPVPSGTIPGGSEHGDYLHWDKILNNWSLGTSQISLGRFAGNTNQAIDGTALGFYAGAYNQSSCAVAIGTYSGNTNQSENAIAIGCNAGSFSQGTNAIAIGQFAGQTNQPQNSIILNASGTPFSATQSSALYIDPIQSGSADNVLFYDTITKEVRQGSINDYIIPDGYEYSDYLFWNQNSTQWEVGRNEVHLGAFAGQTSQLSYAIAIGQLAGSFSQGKNSIAIGQFAGQTSQPEKSIILNASGTPFSATQASALYIDPIRNATASQALFYDPTSKEITYSDPTFSGSLALQTYTYAYFQARDAVMGKFMMTDCADKDAFYRLRVSNPQTLFEGSTLYDSSPLLFDNDVSSANATVTGPTNAYMTLSVSSLAGANDYAARQTHFYAHYQPGKSFLAMFSFSFGTFTPGILKRVGFYDVNNLNSNNPLNGVLLEQTDTGVLRWLVYKGDGTFQVANQSNWNVDPLNGTGQSGYTLDPTKNLLGFVDLEWLGVGRVRTGFFINGVPIICNTFNNSSFDTPYINNPLLPIRYEIRKTTAGGAFGDMKVVCCTIISEGGFVSLGVVRSLRSNSLQLSGVSPALSSIGSCIGIRLKSTCSRAILQPITVEIVSNLNGNGVAYYSVYLWRPSSSTTPSGLTWTSVANESFVEYNVTTGGIPNASDLYRQMIADTTGTSIQIEQGTVSTVTKTSFAEIISNLLIAQSNIIKANTDIIVVVVDNTSAGPTGHDYSAIITWKEL